MVRLQGLQGFFIALDGGLELADVFCATLAEGCLGLAIALLTLLRGRIDLKGQLRHRQARSDRNQGKQENGESKR